MSFTYNGSTIYQPGVIGSQTSGGMAAQTTSNRMVVLLGISGGGGQPLTLQPLGGKDDAAKRLVSGPLQTAGIRAFMDASSPNVSYMRVNPAMQSSYDVQSAAAQTVITLQSTDYGQYTGQIAAQIVAGSVQGIKAIVTQGSNTYSQDNLYQSALSIQYTGSQASGLVAVSNASGNITGSAGPSGTETVQWTAAFSTYTTIQDLVNYINSQTGWTASVLTSSPSGPTANALDDATSQECKATAFTVTGTLQAVVNWFNSVPIITASRATNTGALPAVMSAPAYLTGGTDGTTTSTNWANAFQAMQNVPQARIVVPVTGDASIHAMAAAHNAYMSDPTVRHNRVAICGGVQGEDVQQAVTRAQNLNTRRVSMTWPGIQDTDYVTGQLTTYDPFIVAGQIAGQLSMLSVTQAMTRKVVTAKGLEGTLQSTLQKADYDTLVQNGIMAIKWFSNSNGSYYGVVRSVTTWLQDTQLDNIELSMVCNEDYVDMAVGDAQDALIGGSGSPLGAGQMWSETDSTLRQLETDGIIVGDNNTPAYSNVVTTVTGDQVVTTYTAVIPVPMNFAGIGASFMPYNGSVVSSNAA